MIRVAVQQAPIDVAAALAMLEGDGVGGVATFTGLVRADDGVDLLELEHYPGVTERVLGDLADQAAARWTLSGVIIVHRVGAMRPGERIVFVAAAAAHRAAALEACTSLIDLLKTQAPFWKRETRNGDARWVEARQGDQAAAQRWAPQTTDRSTLRTESSAS